MKQLFSATAIALGLTIAAAPAYAAPGNGNGKGKAASTSTVPASTSTSTTSTSTTSTSTTSTSTTSTSTTPTAPTLDCKAASFSFTACSGSYALSGGQNDVTDGGANNLATQYLNGSNIFNEANWSDDLNWTFGAKYDGKMSGNNNEGFSVKGLDSTSGTFSFDNIDLATTDIAVSLKSASGFSLYYIKAGSIADPSQLAWDTAGTSVNGKGSAQGLSHISYYTRISAVTPELQNQLKKVPEPAAMSALLVVGMTAAMRRKKMAVA